MRAICSLFSLARVLGRISPKISTTTVMTMVAAAGPYALPSRAVATTVAIEALAILTTLLPTRIVERVRSKFSAI